MQRDARTYLADMREAAANVARFAQGKDINIFQNDQQFRWSIERGLEIVGEALAQLHKLDAATAESIVDWRAIIAFRNILVHAYFKTDH